MFLEDSNWNGWTYRQREVVPQRQGTRVKGSFACVVWDTRDQQTNSFAWSQWMGWKRCGKHGVEINRLFFMKTFGGQQTDLEQCSKFYWQPMKGTKQWNTASKRRWLQTYTSTPNCSLIIRNCLIDFAVEHRFSCCATEPGCAGDIGAIEIWLIEHIVYSQL